ncbi:MAG: hypothetical protein ACJA0T_000048 [Colwellia sp.]|jgi:hypothetical protein
MKLTQLIVFIIILLCSLSASAEQSKKSLLKNKRFTNLIQTINKKNTLSTNSTTTEVDNLGIPEGEELVLTLKNNKLLLGEIFAYKSSTTARLGLINTLEVLDFPIEVDADFTTAKGWFINESNTFELTLPNASNNIGTAVVNGETFTFSKDAFEIQADDIYVDAKYLAAWFGFEFNFNFSKMVVKVKSEQTLPIVSQNKRRKQKTISTMASQPVLPWKESAYKAISSPLYDVSLFSTKDSESSMRAGYSVLGNQDIAYLNTEYYITGSNEDALTDFRVKFSKDLQSSNILGIKHFEFGDITPVKSGAESTGSITRGLAISSAASNEITDYDTINLNGNIQPGWDVELYRNGVLLKTQTTEIDGRYDFNDITMFFGNNNLELIFYGPQGQVEKRIEQVVVNGNVLDSNQINYSASISELNKTLFNISDNGYSPNEGWLFSGKVSRGFTDWFSASLGQSYLFNADATKEDSKTYTLGTNLSLFNHLLINTDFSIDDKDTKQLNLTVQSFIGNHAINFNHRNLFAGDKTQDSVIAPVDTWSDQILVSGPLFKVNDIAVFYENSITQTGDDDKNKSISFSNYLSTTSHGYSLSNSIFWQNTESSSSSQKKASGKFSFSKRFGKVNTRISASYSIKPDTHIDTYDARFNWYLHQKLQSDLSLSYVPDVDFFRSKIGFNWNYDIFNVAINSSYDSNDNWHTGLNLNFSFGIDQKNNKLFMSKQKMSNTGALMARVFEDTNANSIYDLGEPLLDGVKVKGMQNYKYGVSDDSGLALISGMSTSRKTDIMIDESTLPDAFMKPISAGSSVTPRKGYLEYLDFPIIVSSEVDGTIYIKTKDGREKPAAFIGLALINEQGKIIANTNTEFDGYYYIAGLLPGKYSISIDKEDLLRKKVKVKEDIQLSFAQGEILDGSDIMLSELEFLNGFVVDAGTFNNLKMLKTYWSLIKTRYQRKNNSKVFFIKDEKNKTYNLYLGFYKNNIEAEDACSMVNSVKIKCSVREFEFGH